MVISMLKIRRPLGRLIFNMGIAIPGKTVFLIETAPRVQIHCDSFAKIVVPKQPSICWLLGISNQHVTSDSNTRSQTFIWIIWYHICNSNSMIVYIDYRTDTHALHWHEIAHKSLLTFVEGHALWTVLLVLIHWCRLTHMSSHNWFK